MLEDHIPVNVTLAKHLDRAVPFDGCRNFRDLGGLRTQDGRAVRRGIVYRSDSMANLTPADEARLRELGAFTLLDLRSAHERNTRQIAGSVMAAHTHWCESEDHVKKSLEDVLGVAGANPATVDAFMRANYAVIPQQKREAYRALMLAILEGRTPVAFFCVWGKDRTGIAAALLLEVLGVSRATIVDDYLLSSEPTRAGFAKLIATPGGRFARFTHLTPETWDALARADVRYLDAMFAAIDAAHGGAARFCSNVLGLDEHTQMRLRDLLLE